eukprot:gene7911-9287_t
MTCTTTTTTTTTTTHRSQHLHLPLNSINNVNTTTTANTTNTSFPGTPRTPRENLSGPFNREWELPEISIRELQAAIPKHCFERNTFTSLLYLGRDILAIAVIGYLATYIDHVDNLALRWLLWASYFLAQGIAGASLWILGHECGHIAFSPSKNLSYSIGFIIHSFLLVPFHSWRISHSKHHKGCGSLDLDQAFLPNSREGLGLEPLEKDPHPNEPHGMLEETPLATLVNMFLVFTLGWPLYFLTNLSGQKYSGWTSHFNPYCGLFDKSQFYNVVSSTIGVGGMAYLLSLGSKILGSDVIVKYYLVPYLFVNFWMVLITYLQHTDPALPHYRDGAWTFQRGAALTIDRDYGWLLNNIFHNTTDAHVVHHFFSTIPHYHAKEATRYIVPILGKNYVYDNTPIHRALWKSWTQFMTHKRQSELFGEVPRRSV